MQHRNIYEGFPNPFCPSVLDQRENFLGKTNAAVRGLTQTSILVSILLWHLNDCFIDNE